MADKFADVGNLAAATLVFGQAIGQDAFSPATALAGVAIWLVLMITSYVLSGEAQ